MKKKEHPIFLESIEYIKSNLGFTGLDANYQSVLERMIHASGDFSLQTQIHFSSGACEIGINALKSGSNILTDTFMAKAAVEPMAQRTINSEVRCILEWAPENLDCDSTLRTRSSIGMRNAWLKLSDEDQYFESPIVVIGSAPTALMELIDLIEEGNRIPSLIIGMPVGFIGVSESKARLLRSTIPHIVLKGSKGGASLAAAAINALLRGAEREVDQQAHSATFDSLK